MPCLVFKKPCVGVALYGILRICVGQVHNWVCDRHYSPQPFRKNATVADDADRFYRELRTGWNNRRRHLQRLHTFVSVSDRAPYWGVSDFITECNKQACKFFSKYGHRPTDTYY